MLGAPEQLHPHRNGEERMTCHDSRVYTEAGKKRVRVNEGGVVQGAYIRVHRRILSASICLSQHLSSTLPVGFIKSDVESLKDGA